MLHVDVTPFSQGSANKKVSKGSSRSNYYTSIKSGEPQQSLCVSPVSGWKVSARLLKTSQFISSSKSPRRAIMIASAQSTACCWSRTKTALCCWWWRDVSNDRALQIDWHYDLPLAVSVPGRLAHTLAPRHSSGVVNVCWVWMNQMVYRTIHHRYSSVRRTPTLTSPSTAEYECWDDDWSGWQA